MLMEGCILLYGVSVPTLNDGKWFLNAIINNNCSKFYFALVYVTVGSRREWQLLLPVAKLNLTTFKTICKNVQDYMYHSCKNIQGSMKFFPDNCGEWTIPIPSGEFCLLHALPFQCLLQWWWPRLSLRWWLLCWLCTGKLRGCAAFCPLAMVSRFGTDQGHQVFHGCPSSFLGSPRNWQGVGEICFLVFKICSQNLVTIHFAIWQELWTEETM